MKFYPEESGFACAVTWCSIRAGGIATLKTKAAIPVKLKLEVFMALTQEDVISALKECYDPEIPVNIVDLGLIYEVRMKPTEVPNLEGEDVEVEMTLTAPGCPSHQYISDQVQQRLLRIPGVGNATVNIVWYPQWTPERLSPEARKQLGIE
ncbi:MAG: metal-sulfur cluster assembly factor [Candidatus Korobacteraceae bacterium]